MGFVTAVVATALIIKWWQTPNMVGSDKHLWGIAALVAVVVTTAVNC